MQKLRINDGSQWSFVRSTWQDGKDGEIELEEVGKDIQIYPFAFYKAKVFKNFKAKFQFRHTGPYINDAGLIFRAVNKTRFYLLHFREVQMASRVGYFWANVSLMDENGYLGIVDRKMVPRVQSRLLYSGGPWHDVEVEVKGNKLSARIDRLGVFEVSGLECIPGRIGVMTSEDGAIKNVEVEGDVLEAGDWDESVEQPENFFYPYDNEKHGKCLYPSGLLKADNGDLILNFGAREEEYKGKVTPLIMRSNDKGRTWSEPAVVKGRMIKTHAGLGGRPHIFPDGKMRIISCKDNQFFIQETPDEGLTWSEPKTVKADPIPGVVDPIMNLMGRACLNLSDGSVVMFGGGWNSHYPKDLKVFGVAVFGVAHYRSFACRSTDNGYTWSSWVNIDGTIDREGKKKEGSLYMHEICAIQTGDGSIMALGRPYEAQNMWETWSRDGGRTWTPCVQGPFPGYATSNMLRTDSGAILVATRLPGTNVHLSLDDGITWDKGTMIDNGEIVMGSMIEVEPDLVLYVYFHLWEDKMRAQFMRVTTEGIMPVNKKVWRDSK